MEIGADMSEQHSLAHALAEFSGLPSNPKGCYSRRVACSERLLAACIASHSATARAALEVLNTETHRILKATMQRVSKTKDAVKRLEAGRQLWAIRHRAAEHALVAYGLVLQKGRKSRLLSESQEAKRKVASVIERPEDPAQVDSEMPPNQQASVASEKQSSDAALKPKWRFASAKVVLDLATTACENAIDIDSDLEAADVGQQTGAPPGKASKDLQAAEPVVPSQDGIRDAGTHDSLSARPDCTRLMRDSPAHERSASVPWDKIPEMVEAELCSMGGVHSPMDGCPWCERRRNEQRKRMQAEGSMDDCGYPGQGVVPSSKGKKQRSGQVVAPASKEKKQSRSFAKTAMRRHAQSQVIHTSAEDASHQIPAPGNTKEQYTARLTAALEQFRGAVSTKGQYAARLHALQTLLEGCRACSSPCPIVEVAVKEMWLELPRFASNVACRKFDKSDAMERVEMCKQLCAAKKKLRSYARAVLSMDLDAAVRQRTLQLQPSLGDMPVPVSLEELRGSCAIFKETNSCRHVCQHLCYFREYEPARQLHTLRKRGASHPLKLSLHGWTARLGLMQKPPFWLVVVHDPSGAVRGSPSEAWQAAVDEALSKPLSAAGSSADAPVPAGSLRESPFGLIEELFASEPWQLLVACFLLNKTARAVVDKLLAPFFRRWPTASALLNTDIAELECLLAPLGLQRKRSCMLHRFSREYLSAVQEVGSPLPMSRLSKLHGAGGYACAAYQIFVRGEVRQARTTDIYLGWFREWHAAATCEQ